MGARSGTALKGLHLFLRGVQFLCATITLALFAYFLATISSHGLPTPDWVPAVLGISGVALFYTALSGLVVCRIGAARHPFTSLLTLVLDAAFTGAFIYVAATNKAGSGSCTGTSISTPFGTGDAAKTPTDGLPTFRQACQMQSACLAAAVIALFFFVFSILTELASIRHTRKQRRALAVGINPISPGGDPLAPPPKRGFFGRLFGGRNKRRDTGLTISPNPNALPQHAQPDDVRESYATDRTRVGTANVNDAHKYESLGYGGHDMSDDVGGRGHGDMGVAGTGYGRGRGRDDVSLAQYPAANYRYDDGVYDRA
ncbi:hypothetical protein B0H67DRAFT_643076 [Lasiosphaeris hirsuta]|uniref:MARVEL domain-containing protein n=1 Tax=Lasiosphaeris hirsuta TaxID=260670 RepID=A0AA40APV7_9PEZI|nr:hypothetical protein B0H67DRAFT_643076 [Lasiosphaeris hirsuta]